MQKHKLFYLDKMNNEEYTYSMLFDNLKQKKSYSRYCYTNNYFEIFSALILSLILDREIVLLDGDFSEEECVKLTGAPFAEYKSELLTAKELECISSFDSLEDIFSRSNSDWKLTLFTSGTTGLPKQVSHTYASLTRFVQKNDKHKTDIWGFAYSPTHMAGLQVFFQALINQNTIIRLFGLNADRISVLIDEYSITHLSATPTFYRLLVSTFEVNTSVLRLTSGGELFDEKLSEGLRIKFPLAEVRNVYASTEAGTLLIGNGSEFYIREELKDRIQIIENELCIHSSLMGNSSFTKNQTWYKTGDMVHCFKKNGKDYFSFIGRNSEMINVGGYKVNPQEVEACIKEFPNIQHAVVYPKKNAILGQMLMAEIVASAAIEEKDLRRYLSERLQEFKIPRIIKCVKQLKLTRTGKLKR